MSERSTSLVDNKPHEPRLPRLTAIVLFCVVAGVAYTLIGAAVTSGAFRASPARLPPNTPIPNPYASRTGANLVAYVVTASDCGWSRQPNVLAAIRTLPETLRRSYGARFKSITVVGVLVDRDVQAGLSFLKEVSGETEVFDQVSVGGGWLNEDAVRLIWKRQDITPASPQIIIVSRDIDAERYLSHSRIRVEGDAVLHAVSGSQQIVKWIREGAHVPDSTEASRTSHSSSDDYPGR